MIKLAMTAEADHDDTWRHCLSVPELVARRRHTPLAAPFIRSVEGIRQANTSNLLRNLQSVEDPLTSWVLHLELDKRDVPPCIRWPRRDETPQMVYLTWLADVYWLARRYPDHQPLYTRWRGLFDRKPASDSWHKTAIWVFRSGHSAGYYHSKGLGLTDRHKQELMTMSSNATRGDREMIKRLPQLRNRIWMHASENRDRAGRFSTDEITDRRVELLRVFLLARRNRTRAARYLELLHGQRISRQALTRQLEAIEVATKISLLKSGS